MVKNVLGSDPPSAKRPKLSSPRLANDRNALGAAAGLDDESSNQSTATTQSPGDSRRLSIQRGIQSLVHACQCRNANCSLPSCQKMKRVVQHTKGCKRKTNGGCFVCKLLIGLCCYHAKHCQENKCPVPFCFNIKHKRRQQQLQNPGMMQGAMGAAFPGAGRNLTPAAVQELLQTLRSPSSRLQRHQVLNILRSNPTVKAFNGRRAARNRRGPARARNCWT